MVAAGLGRWADRSDEEKTRSSQLSNWLVRELIEQTRPRLLCTAQPMEEKTESFSFLWKKAPTLMRKDQFWLECIA